MRFRNFIISKARFPRERAGPREDDFDRFQESGAPKEGKESDSKKENKCTVLVKKKGGQMLVAAPNGRLHAEEESKAGARGGSHLARQPRKRGEPKGERLLRGATGIGR